MMRRVALLGATGSIGDSALDVIARHPERFTVAALAAHRNVAKLGALCRRFRPAVAALLDVEAARTLAADLAGAGLATRVLAGPEGLEAAAALGEADTVLAAIVGAAGLRPTLAAARAGKRILLANKEALVIGGALFMRAVEEGGAALVPIDSEHNAIFQCLPGGYRRDPGKAGVRRILLTASGGPLRDRPVADFPSITPDEACAHPNWSMGRKISVDSATMMNKGLEVIEAHWLFGVPRQAIDVVVHPQSVIHSLVEYVDGSVLAQLGHPDMRTPIAQALAHPDRIDAGVPRLELPALAALAFAAPDLGRFPCLGLAYAALDAGGSAPVTLNAANEVAVEAFLAGRARFTDIAATCAEALARLPALPIRSLDEALAADAEARRVARESLGRADSGPGMRPPGRAS
jgi:1-deoxy-D-xylulose-5-phosphate reductoisomerase